MTDIDEFRLPDPRMESFAWFWDNLHTPRPLPPLVGDAWEQQFSMVMGRPSACVNGYGYMGLGPGGAMLQVETAPQSDGVAAWREFYLPRIKAIVARLANTGFEAMTAPELASAVPETGRDQAAGFAMTMAPLMLVGAPAATLMEFCTRHFGAEGDLLALTMIAGHDNETSSAAAGLAGLAALARSLPGVAEALPGGRAAILQQEGGARFMERFDAYLLEYGAGNQTWFEFHRPSWQEDPAVPLAAVAGYLEVDFDAARDRAGRARETAIADAMARLPSDGDRERLTGILSAARDYVDIIEDRARWQLILSAQQRRPALALGRKLAAAGRLRAADDVFLLHLSELDGMATGSTLIPLPELERRELAWRRWATLTPPRTLGQPLPAGMAQVPMMGKMFGMGGPPPGEGAVLRGHPGSAGTAEGIARVLLDLDDADRLGDGEILVCPFTAPPWTPLFGVAAAVVTDAGGVLSHAAIAAREFAIPAVVGVQAATTRITDGARIRVDGAAGTVEIVA